MLKGWSGRTQLERTEGGDLGQREGRMAEKKESEGGRKGNPQRFSHHAGGRGQRVDQKQQRALIQFN